MTADLELCRIEIKMRMLRANIARDKAHLRRLAVELLLHLYLRRSAPATSREREHA